MLKRAWQAWMRVAHKVGTFQARVLLTIFYVVLMFPFGIAARLFFDPLRIKHRPTKWLDHPDENYNQAWARRQ